ncbi:MAG: S41 family peptidase [Chitinophagales bacterium]|nr:S41 family peptidase [Chitinophagales bacterium]
MKSRFFSGQKLKRPFIVAALVIAALIPFAFTGNNNYFEISKNLDVFATLYKEVNTYYVDDIEPAKFMRTGIDAMLESLDPYTNYISEADIEGYRFQTTGKYGGIGAIIRKSGDNMIIAEPYKGFAADKAGLIAGDILLEVEGKSTKGKSVDDISKILKGTPGTEIKILIQHPGEKNTELKTFMREEVKVNSVPYWGMVNNNIGYIRLTQFTENCGQDVANALKELESKNQLKGLVFDLRGNPGGLLNEAVNVSNIFIDKGQLVVSTKGKVKEWDKIYNSLNEAIDAKIPLVILANSGSASASEIVSGTIQDYDRGVIIGQKTYGKGLVQTTRPLTYGTQLKVTTAHYFTPSGRCIQALDYEHRNEDGSVGKIPDSLKHPFKTKAGRTVFDGGGVDPDFVLVPEKFSPIAGSLYSKNLIFDYATQYKLAHATIPSAMEFHLTDAEYDDFVKSLNGKDYDYTTKSEEKLKDFKSAAENEEYWAALKEDYEHLQSEMKHDKENDLVKFKDEIKGLLEEEISMRYYYQNGRIEASLKDDPEVAKAIEVLNDTELYTKTLQASK